MAAVSLSRRLNLVDFKPIFVTYLNPTVTFLSHLTVLVSTEEANDIQNLITVTTREAAVSLFLEKLERKQQEPGIFTIVVQALDKSDQGHIAEMLKSGQNVPDENTRRVKYLIDVFSIALTKVRPLEMSPYLRCLNNEELAQIDSCTKMSTNERGALKMFSLLVLKGTTEMFAQLVEALKKTGHKEVATNLEDLQSNDCDDLDCCEEDKECRNIIPADSESTASDGLAAGATQLQQHQPHAENLSGVTQVQQRQELNLRNYQEELAAPALPEGGSKNIIVVAATGSGKTLVAVKVAMEFLRFEAEYACCSIDKTRPKKVVFLVNQVTLVHQQTQRFQDYLGTSDVIGLSGETTRALSLDELLKKKSVMVMTAQVLVNALQENIVRLADIGLLILDECHNCQKGTPYNRIMSIYRDMVIDKQEPRPQILGMSASLDIGQAKSEKQAVDKVWLMCANLDARLISLVNSTDGKRELEEHLNIPTERIIEVAGRTNDRFLKEVSTSMKMIEDIMQGTPGFKQIVDSNPQLRTSGNYGSQTYEQWVVQLQNDILEKEKDKPMKRRLVTCTDHLKVYNDSLYINRDIRTKDAVSKLAAYLAEQTGKEGGFDETDQLLVDLLKEKIPNLKAISEDPSSSNPVLNKLGEILEQAFQISSEIPEKRGILFTKTRESVEALMKWITETEELKFLNPGRLIGSGRYGGMTQNQQVDVLKLFREGGHKLIVATSVAQEGLDIAECNVVVQYNCISSVVAHVQARGRNRAKGGQFFMVLDEQQKLSNKTLTNRIREQMMKAATQTVHKKLLMEPQDSIKKITDIQIADQNERKQKKSNESRRKKLLIKDRVRLTCLKCGELACYNYDIRCVKDAHRIVISDAFKERYDTKHNPKYPRLIDGLDMRMTLVCVKCKALWGTQAIYQGMELPLLNIAGFVAEYPNGRQKRVKKWKDVAFQVEPVTYIDLEKMLTTESTVSVEE
ncbi:antiviral innate immune response receptor RIG-I-like [Amphiura filiformis]|uniref:antiviral innate immune response receptor RIG-I-like n=1 Tax=Amphiura filiformis TaxID=82378 RepID=UPI003B226FEA